jgi:hypothetical protein
MNEKQVNEIADGIMGDAIATQSALETKRKEAEKSAAMRRKIAIGGSIGLVVGLAVGYFGFDSLMPAGLFGAISGMTSIRWLDKR